jgi:hypothetical protein
MVIKSYKKAAAWIENHRFKLLLVSTILVLILPAFSGGRVLSDLLFWITMTFMYIQSVIAANAKGSRKVLIWFVLIVIIFISWLKPMGIESIYIEVLRIGFFTTFFSFVVSHLFRYIRMSPRVDLSVLITSLNIYLIFGIIGGSLAFLMYEIYPAAYTLPGNADSSTIMLFIYYSFVTMSTVGYGDIVPARPETQTLGYFIAITGQLYVAVIIAFLVGKFMMQSGTRSK